MDAAASDRRPSLLEIAEAHGTNKVEHGYVPFYEELFAARRWEPLNILELGVGGFRRQDDCTYGGNSLRMWKAYFPVARIVGLDLLDKSGVAEDRVAIAQGSQTDELLLRRLHEEYGPFDVVIDDASHIPALTNESFRILFPLLAPRGVYVIEDLCTSYWPLWGGSFRLRSRKTTMALVKARLDGLNHAEFKLPSYSPSSLDRSIAEVRVRHNIVAFLKGDNTAASAMNRPNPCSQPAWLRDDFFPACAHWAKRPSVLRALDAVGLRSAASALRRMLVPRSER